MTTLTEFLLERIAEDERQWTNPAFVFHLRAECEAKRRIVNDCRVDYEDGLASGDDTVNLATEVLHSLAIPYADHPDYRQEWKP